MSRKTEHIAKEISILLPKWLRGMRAGFITSSAITTSQLIVLLAIYEKGTIKAGRLSKQMRVSAPTITGIVDRLARSNYLKRTPDDKDRRAINIQLTKKGEMEAKRFLRGVRNRWKSILSHIEPEEGEMFLKIFKRILGVIGEKSE